MARQEIPGSEEWLAEHGIAPEVWEARGVWRYGAEDGEAVWNEVGSWLGPTRKSWLFQVLRQCPGLVMPKHPIPGRPPIPPQLRPDGVTHPVTGEVEKVVTSPLPRYHFHPSEWNPQVDTWPRYPWGEPLEWQFIMRDPDRALPHIVKAHPDGNDESVHTHGPNRAKYVFLTGPPKHREKRIDLHPLAAERLRAAKRVFFVMEGALKNDAVLSAGEAVFSIPAVGLWTETELNNFALFHLRDKMVFVVPDADWYVKRGVYREAVCREVLRRALGDQSVYITAPPIEFYEAMQAEGIDDQKGVDDWLGTRGRAYAQRDRNAVPGIDGLEIRGREPEREVRLFEGARLQRRALIGLALHAVDSTKEGNYAGVHRRSLIGLAQVMGLGSHPERAIPILEGLPGITIHGSLDWTLHEFRVPVKKKSRREKQRYRLVKVKDWRDMSNPPTIEMQPGFRAYEPQGSDGRPTLLGDFWQRTAYEEMRRRTEEMSRRIEAIEERLGFTGKLAQPRRLRPIN